MYRNFLALLACLAVQQWSSAGIIEVELFDGAFNIDQQISNPFPPFNEPVPPELDLSAFDETQGLGTIKVTITGAGSHSVFAFFDHEIIERDSNGDIINDYFNEIGTVFGTPAAGQSWEIDEPGFFFGDIFDNFKVGMLDGMIGEPSEDDVSMAMGWDFSLAANESALVQFFLSTSAPTSGFYLQHGDIDVPQSVFLSSSLEIRQVGVQVIPEPSSYAIWAVAFGAVTLVTRRRRRSRSDAK